MAFNGLLNIVLSRYWAILRYTFSLYLWRGELILSLTILLISKQPLITSSVTAALVRVTHHLLRQLIAIFAKSTLIKSQNFWFCFQRPLAKEYWNWVNEPRNMKLNNIELWTMELWQNESRNREHLCCVIFNK